MRHRLAHRVGRSSQATTAAVDKSQSASHTEIRTLPDTVAGAHASANLYSLLQTCAANGIDGYKYLRAVLVALPRATTVDDYAALLPGRIKMLG